MLVFVRYVHLPFTCNCYLCIRCFGIMTPNANKRKINKMNQTLQIKKNLLKSIPLFLLFLAKAALCSGQTADASNRFYLGADISATTQLESQGIFSYNNKGELTENTKLMKQLGLNAIRLRVWVNPEDGWSSPRDVLEMALRAKREGMALMINFHYSDSWADPGKQYPPKAWAELDYRHLKQALARHTEATLRLLKQHGVDVEWVQVGNETTHGMLWETGRAETHMKQYAGLTLAGYRAVKRIYPRAKVIVHLDSGFDNDLYNRIFDGLKRYGARWDVIGMSLYPYWAMADGREPDAEKTLDDCIANINAVAAKYNCDVMVVETGVEADKPKEGKIFMQKLLQAALHRTANRCRGVFYWAPECCHGPYKLGAFNHDRPTEIMDAFTETARELKTLGRW